MALPEDDVEEIDPEPSIARILDHDHDAIVIGPGLRPGLATAELVRQLLAAPDDDSAPRSCSTPRRCARSPRWTTGGRAIARRRVLTPHAGEFGRLRAGSGHDPAADGDLLDDDAARAAAARDAAAEWRQVVVLKGARSVIAAPDGAVAVAPFENPALASGGTGDVMAGHDRRAARAGSRSVRGSPPRRLSPRPRRRAGPRADRDAGLLASDLPDAVATSRARAGRHRRSAPRRAASGCGFTAARPATRPSPARRDRAAAQALDRGAPGDCRPAAAATDRVARARPRRARRQPRNAAGRLPGLACRSARW